MKKLDLKEVGLSQRFVCFAILGYFILGLIVAGIGESALIVFQFFFVFFSMYFVWKLCSALQFHVIIKIFCVVLMAIPLICLFTLVIINSMATAALRNAGISVGFLGAKRADLLGKKA